MNAAPRVAGISAVLALVLATVWLFWPTGLGGGTTYVTTHGTSMEPDFHAGDMVVLTPADAYALGDVVAYYSESLDTVVMHRIVSGDSNGFVTQGDNNDWLDDDRPTQDEILGRLFIRIPQAGKALDALRSTGALVPLAAVALAGFGAARRPRGRRAVQALRRRVPGFALPAGVPFRGMPAMAGPRSMPTRARARQVALGAGAVTLLAAAGCGVLLALPPTQTDTTTLQVTQEGEFSYAGAAVPGTTYPSGVIATGDTVWTRLVRSLSVSFTDSVTGPQLSGLTGSLRLDVVVSAPDGWSAVVTSGAAAAFHDGTATASVPIDADAAAQLLRQHHDEIGTGAGSATLTVTPVAGIAGTVQGRSFTAGAPPGLTFTLDGMSLQPSGDAATRLTPMLQTPVQIEDVAPRILTIRDVSVPLDEGRQIAGALLLLALATLGVAAWLGRTGPGDVADQFLVRHADRILPVDAFTPGPTVIDVSDVESLHRVAERFDTVVLHHAGPDEDVFAVRDLDATYRFVVPGSPDRRRGKPPVPAAAPAPPEHTSPLPLVTDDELADETAAEWVDVPPSWASVGPWDRVA